MPLPRLLLAGFFTAALSLQAQMPGARFSSPRIGYVYPAGGRQGTTFKVTVGGQFLDGINAAEFFGAGITARVLDYQHPLTPKEDNELRGEIEKLQAKRQAALSAGAKTAGAGPQSGWTPEDEKLAAEIRARAGYRMNRQTAPAISEAVTLEVTIAPGAAPGQREIRLRNANGVSNPLFFFVGQLPEFSEPAAPPSTAAPGGPNPANPRPLAQNPGRTVTLPAVINGQIMPGGVDRIRFAARKGQKLVFAVSARALIPYLADAVPGWFQATLAIRDAQGHELAYDDHFRFNPDPVLFCKIPADGDYFMEIRDSIYRGRQDFVYRITAGELPFITGIFPLGGRSGQKTTVELAGWNLPAAKAEADAAGKPTGSLTLAVERDGIFSNPVTFALDADPDCAEVEPNDDVTHAQKLALPVIVNGRIEQPGDRDVFSFEGRAGDGVVIEVFARRLNSPLDSLLQLTDAQGKTIAANDDYEDKGAGLITHQADSRISLKLPADGTYYIHLADAEHQGGPEYAYRLHLHLARPDFDLRVVPSSINVRAGANAVITVFALRKDNFDGPIAVQLAEAPDGFSLNGAEIPAGQDQIRLTLGAPPTAPGGSLSLTFAGRAQIGAKTVVHEAVPAEDLMQAFAYRHLVPAREQWLTVTGRLPGRLPAGITGDTPVKIAAGGEGRLKVSVPASVPQGDIRLELNDPPDGISLKEVSRTLFGSELVFQADAVKVKPGLRGNLIVQIVLDRKPDAQARAKGQARVVSIPINFLPAIPFTVVAP